MRFVPLLWSNLKRRKIRTVCTGLSILVAFLLIGALLSLRTGFSRGVDLTGADRLVISQKTAVNQPMPLAYRDRLAAIPGVAAVTYLAAFRGLYQDPRNAFPQLAVDTDTWFEMYRDLWVVPDDQLARWRGNRTGALIGQELADRFGSTLNFQSMSQVAFAFAVTPALIAQGMTAAVSMGLVGAMWPAWRAATISVANGLRKV